MLFRGECVLNGILRWRPWHARRICHDRGNAVSIRHRSKQRLSAAWKEPPRARIAHWSRLCVHTLPPKSRAVCSEVCPSPICALPHLPNTHHLSQREPHLCPWSRLLPRTTGAGGGKTTNRKWFKPHLPLRPFCWPTRALRIVSAVLSAPCPPRSVHVKLLPILRKPVQRKSYT